MSRHSAPAGEFGGWAPGVAFGNRTSMMPLRLVTGACVLRRNAVTWTTVASFGSDGIALAALGAISTTTASPNVPIGQLSVVNPSELCSSPAAYGTAFFSTGGTFV